MTLSRLPDTVKPTPGGINDDVVRWLGQRSAAFAVATSRPPGKAMEYGKIKKEPKR